mmetsp:Transcript_156944/g.273203  ORF Transcript_156944/g.273203 Transcript_156944/m.273203 type:complete len:566 (+) Transcript_156944:164-1861(+)
MMFGDLGPGGDASEDAPQGNLFHEVNKLRRANDDDDEKRAEEAERAKLNNTVFAKIAIDKRFEWLTLSFILVNAGFIGYDADYSARFKKPDNLYDKDTPLQFMIFENIFCVYFTVEVIIRFFAFRKKYQCCCDSWFVFDSILVLFMVIETWILPIVGASGPLSQLSILRLLRLARITRMAKLMRFFPELQIIVKGMVASVRSVGVTALLLFLLLYVFAILFTSEYHQGNKEDSEFEGDEPEYLFGSMAKSMRSLFIMGTILDDITYCTNTIRSSGKTMMLVAFILFVLISSFTILNMLIGILCEVVGATGEGEREKNLQVKVRAAIGQLFEKMDKDKNGEISQQEFMSMRHNQNVLNALKDLDIKEKHFDLYAQLLFKPEEDGGPTPTFDWEKTVNMIIRLRPGTTVSALDFATFQMAVFKNHESMKQHINKIERMCAKLHAQDSASPPKTGVLDQSALPYSPPGTANSIVTATPPGTANSLENGDGLTVSGSTPNTLDHTSSQDILAELQRRLGMGALNLQSDAGKVDALETLSPSKVMEAFETLCVPQPDADTEAWSKETYTC